jgi:ribosomal protein L27
VLLVQTGTSRDAISERLGREWTGIDTVDGGDLLLFLRGADVVRFADYRGSNAFAGFERPFAEIPREQAVFTVRDRVVRPA